MGEWKEPPRFLDSDPFVLSRRYAMAGFSIAHMSRWAYPQNRNIVILGEKHREVLDWCLEFAFETLASFQRVNPCQRL